MSAPTDGLDQFSASSAPGSPVVACAAKPADCKSLWAASEKKADDILARGKGDPIETNKSISAAYAQTYESNKNLKWSGTAAFASKQVGCGMKSAKAMAERSDRTLDAELNYPSESGVDPITPIQSMASHTMYDGLAKGNRAVFKEIYPAMQFYNDNGLARLKQCADARNPKLSGDLVSAFDDIDKGHLDEGSEKMLRYEQSQTLQKSVYDDAAVRRTLKANSLGYKYYLGRILGAEPVKVSFTPECSGGTEVEYKGTNLADFNDRWPYAKNVAETFNKMARDDPAGVDKSLQTIIDRGR